MASNKRIKLDKAASDTPLMSAFAARKRLWGGGNPVAPEEPTTSENAGEKKLASPPTRQPQGQKKGVQMATEEDPEATDGSVPTDSSSSQLPTAMPDQIVAPPGFNDGDQPSSKPIVRHSTFRPSKALKNYQRTKQGHIVLNLVEEDRLVVLGSYRLRVREGSATVAGAILLPADDYRYIYAPHCHALPVVRSRENTVLELMSHAEVAGLKSLERLNPVFRKLWQDGDSKEPDASKGSGTPDSFQIIYTSEDGPKRALLRDLVSPAEWNRRLAEITAFRQKKRAPSILVCGPKSSGKSTFGKLLANRLVTDQGGSNKRTWPGVAVIDLDPGQPEYGPPGVISLSIMTDPNLSPPFCHPVFDSRHNQVRAHAIASVTPALGPEHFVNCTQDLFSCYQKKLGGKYPLVINTPGWIQGTGLDILTELVARMKPTEVVYMSQDGPEETTEALKAACQNIPFQELPSQPSNHKSRTSLHFRTMQMMSYFHTECSTGAFPSWQSGPLTEVPPWRVRYKGTRTGFLGILCYDYQPPSDLLAESINGMILALVLVEDKAAFQEFAADRALVAKKKSNQPGYNMDVDNEDLPPALADSDSLESQVLIARTPESIPLIPNPQGKALDPAHSRVLGLALVRGIDRARGELQLLTPVPATELSAVAGPKLVLVSGRFDTPRWAYTEDLHSRAFDTAEAAGEEAGEGNDEGGENGSRGKIEMADEETSEDSSEDEKGVAEEDGQPAYTESPWVEKLHGNQRRSVGSRVWRVRRDLGRT